MGEAALARGPRDDASPPVLVGRGALSIRDVVDVAVHGARVSLAPEARHRMARSRAVVEEIQSRGDPVYGLTTGVGAQKTIPVTNAEQEQFNRDMILGHGVGHGPLAPTTFTRAALLVRAEGLALGYAGVRPQVAEALLMALNDDAIPRVHLIGSVGQSDLAPLAEIGRALIGEGPDATRMRRAGLQPLRLAAREALAIIGSNAFSLGVAALAVDRAWTALGALERSAALAFEGFSANVAALDPVIGVLRPHAGIRETLDHLRGRLEGGTLLSGTRPARNLQDPLCFRVVPQTYAATLDSLRHAHRVIEIELRSASDNPAVLIEDGRAVANGNHDGTPITVVLDYARLGLAQAVTTSIERIAKLLDARFTGLNGGLRARADVAQDALGVLGHGGAALAAEIRLLAAPVALELPTSSLAEGIEDRISLAPLAARRLYEMAGHSARLAAVELVCAAQAVDLRDIARELGRGTAKDYAAVRARQPFIGPRETPDHDLDPLVRWLEESREAMEPA